MFMELLYTHTFALLAALAVLSLLLGSYYGWSYRGWHLKRNREERRKLVVSILSHLNPHEREEFFNFIEGLRTPSKSTS